jgi:hypothetical protein
VVVKPSRTKKVIVKPRNEKTVIPVHTGGSIPYGGDCTNARGDCMAGLSCSPSQLNGSDRWTCK